MSRIAVIAIALVAACGGPSKENKEVCQKGYDRYVQCIGETMGKEMQKMVASPEKDGRDQCAKDQRTVDAYKKCFANSDTSCQAFMDCVMDIAMADPR
jgi:Cys-rich protein (TIGR04453 family)